MNDDNDDLIRFASEILTVRDELDPRVFNRNGAVHEHLRLRMLDRADYLEKELEPFLLQAILHKSSIHSRRNRICLPDFWAFLLLLPKNSERRDTESHPYNKPKYF